MRQRTTFFHDHDNGVDPKELKITSRSISGPDLTAIREDRVTISLDELPDELQQLLQTSPELHLRWSSPFAYDSIGPWNSKLSPGLHLFYTPQSEAEFKSDAICQWLQSSFSISDCVSPQRSFTALPHDRFSHSAAYQYYHSLSTLDPFVQYTQQLFCDPASDECKSDVGRLASATALDLSWDAISQVLKVTAMWPHERQSLSISSYPGHRSEVGILTHDKPPHLDSHELGVSGLLTVLGENDEPSPTLFAFPARHRNSEASFSSGFLEPTGLHPTMQLRMSSAKPPVDDSYCSLHAHLTLPRTVFADKYQLGDDLFLSSKNLTSLRFMSQPVDLEAPDYVMDVWGSSVLLELQPPTTTNADVDVDQDWTAEVPLHLRYLSPNHGGYQTVEVPYPVLFWACTVEEGTKFPNSPFDRTNLGYDGLFGPRTSLWHVPPKPEVGGSSSSNNRLTNDIKVPVLDLSKSQWVNTGTGVVVLLGFAWVVWKIFLVVMRTGYGNEGSSSNNDAKKKKQ